MLPFIVENFTNGRALIPKMSYVNGLLPKPDGLVKSRHPGESRGPGQS